MEVARCNGLEIAYERVGHGPPLVFVHGAGDDHRVWQPQRESLSDEFTVISWDEPGCGQSSDLPREFALADYADCLAEVIRSSEESPAHVVGLSWGGVVALELYRRHPELVEGLVLADTYAGWKGSLPPEEVEARIAGIRQLVTSPADAPDTVLPGIFAGDPPERFVPLLAQLRAGFRPASLAIQVQIIAGTDHRELLPLVTCPTLLIWGEHDVRSPLSVARQFEQAIPHAALVVIPDAGHLSNLERPDQFNAAIRAFCASE